ncbi:MAG: ribosome rescue protein RqcH [Methanosphaera sp.]|nr:ribosome rescue protein RqcH [Methanosphaera sp.]
MKSMSNVDIHRIVKELNDEILNVKVEKAYQPSYDTILIKLRKAGVGRKDLVIQAGTRIHLTEYPLPNPTIPPHFPMLLRKHLSGGIITSIRQYQFDRIVEITVEKKEKFTLIVELFNKGNVILLNKDDNIISPLKHEKWHDRKITSHEKYKYPPSKIDIKNTTTDEIKEIMEESDKDIVRTLATNGLGGLYAEEILSYTDIDKEKSAKDLSDDEILEIYEALRELFERIEKNPKAQIIIEDVDDKKKNKDLVPISLNKYSSFKTQEFESFNKAADEFYSKKIVNNIKEKEENAWTKKINKYKKRLEMQEESLEGFYKTIEDTQIKGNTIYAHYGEVQEILDVIANARKNYSWQEIGKIIKKSKKEGNTPGLELIESIDKMGVITLNLDGMTVRVDSNLGIAESCEEFYYNKGKKAKRKIEGVKNAIENSKAQIEKLENKKEVAMSELKTHQKREKKQLKWYEKLRWFITSDGYMVIGGRDAHSNEQVVKRYSKSNDIYFHCDIHGAPSTIVQNDNNDEAIPESTLYEAACFASSYSSAWGEGFSSYDAYWVNLDQVSKTPEAGEFLKKGSFVIRGRKNFIRNVPVLIAVGVVDYDDDKRIMAGPVDAVRRMSDSYVILKPGFTKKERMAKEVLHLIDKDNLFNVDDIVRNLPSGKCDILDEREYNQKYAKKS